MDPAQPVCYRVEVREALLEHGLMPAATTSPQFLRAAINDLYRYEIRTLRGRLLAGAIAKPDYVGHVIALRRRYVLLSVPTARWTT